VPHVVVMGFEGDKIAHEHPVDQAYVLAQISLLDPKIAGHRSRRGALLKISKR
jgi:hypothetical protein